MPDAPTPSPLPSPRHERWPLVLAVVCLLAGGGLLTLALTAKPGGSPVADAAPAAAAPPAPTPVAVDVPAAPAAAPAVLATSANHSAKDERRERVILRRNGVAHVRGDWVSGFYAIYDRAARTFGVNWLLLASVHKQETGFSTNAGTYHGLNFAGCCAGPMQFNVRNGVVSTWDVFQGAYRYGQRPASYPHVTDRHPSVYDDFDAIMAGAWLLSSSGARSVLDGTAWQAAFDYYGHDATGVTYADEVLARAIGWSQHSFCANCATDPGLVDAVHAAYGAPALSTLAPPPDESGNGKQGGGDHAVEARTKHR
jgi:hypothetical protein